MSDIYSGRLVCDGYGNLLADEGERAGEPVALHEGSYVFLQPGEPSHNARYEERALEIVATQDADENAPGYAGTESSPTEGNEHHFGVTEDDPHVSGPIFDPDKVAAKVTGHTDAYKGVK